MSDDLQSWVDDARDGLSAQRGRRDFADVIKRAAEVSELDVTEEALTGFVVDSREALDRRIESAPRSATFDEMMQRAHALAPDVVDASKLAESSGLAPVVDLHRPREDNGLDRFVQEARGGVEAKVRERRMGPISTGPVPAVAPAGGKRWIAAVVVAAAGLLGVVYFAAPQIMTPSVTEEAEQALLIEDRAGTEGDAVERAPEPVPKRPAERAEPAPAVEEPEAEPEPEVDVEVPRARPRVPVAKVDLVSLAAEAERQWRAGELAAAEKTLRKIVKRGGRSRHAENAFSDLFALAHRRGDRSARKRWWRAYLDRFPRGRFADDARAGLCRAAPDAKRVACWTQYLSRHPKGSYRSEAERATKG